MSLVRATQKWEGSLMFPTLLPIRAALFAGSSLRDFVNHLLFDMS